MNEPRIVIYFVPRKKIKLALVDMQSDKHCWVKCADYLKEDDTFAVQTVFKTYYPYLADQFKRWETES